MLPSERAPPPVRRRTEAKIGNFGEGKEGEGSRTGEKASGGGVGSARRRIGGGGRGRGGGGDGGDCGEEGGGSDSGVSLSLRPGRSTREPSRRNRRVGWRGSGRVDRAGPTPTGLPNGPPGNFEGFNPLEDFPSNYRPTPAYQTRPKCVDPESS